MNIPSFRVSLQEDEAALDSLMKLRHMWQRLLIVQEILAELSLTNENSEKIYYARTTIFLPVLVQSCTSVCICTWLLNELNLNFWNFQSKQQI